MTESTAISWIRQSPCTCPGPWPLLGASRPAAAALRLGLDRALSSSLPAGRLSPRARRGWGAVGARRWSRPRDARGSALRVTVACPVGKSPAMSWIRQSPCTCPGPDARRIETPEGAASDAVFWPFPRLPQRGGADGQKIRAWSPQATRPETNIPPLTSNHRGCWGFCQFCALCPPPPRPSPVQCQIRADRPGGEPAQAPSTAQAEAPRQGRRGERQGQGDRPVGRGVVLLPQQKRTVRRG